MYFSISCGQPGPGVSGTPRRALIAAACGAPSTPPTNCSVGWREELMRSRWPIALRGAGECLLGPRQQVPSPGALACWLLTVEPPGVPVQRRQQPLCTQVECLCGKQDVSHLTASQGPEGTGPRAEGQGSQGTAPSCAHLGPQGPASTCAHCGRAMQNTQDVCFLLPRIVSGRHAHRFWGCISNRAVRAASRPRAGLQ